MSNSYAQPILRTPDLAEGLRVVERLLAIAELGDISVDLDVRIFSEQTLAPLLELLPGAQRLPESDLVDSTATGGELSAHLPMRLREWGMPLQVVQPFLRAVDDNPATVRWDFAGWPPAPEVGLDVGGTRGAFITLCANARDLDLDFERPGTDHTLFVHVKQIEAHRAPWLAAQVGLSVIGDLVMAPY
ncbi:hypothetical protein [Streptomyces sp. NPDC002853]